MGGADLHCAGWCSGTQQRRSCADEQIGALTLLLGHKLLRI